MRTSLHEWPDKDGRRRAGARPFGLDSSGWFLWQWLSLGGQSETYNRLLGAIGSVMTQCKKQGLCS